MTPKRWLIFVLSLVGVAATSFAFGRGTRPEPEVREVVRTEWRDRVITRTVVQREEAKTRVVYRDRVMSPDGTVREREVEREDTKVAERTDAKTDTTTEGKGERVVTVTPRAPDWKAGFLVGAPVLSSPLIPVIGLHAERRILGPLWAGVWVLQPGSLGLSLSMEF